MDEVMKVFEVDGSTKVFVMDGLEQLKVNHILFLQNYI